MIQVTFNYDPDTNSVSGVSVVGADVKASAPKATPKTKSKATKTSDKVVLNGSSLKLNQDVLDLLKVKVGDRLCVRFNPQPVLVRPEIANEPKGGNLITKSLTVSVKGKTSETILEHGTDFGYSLKSDGYLILHNDGNDDQEAEQAEFTEEQIAQLDTPAQEINEQTIDDTDFLSDIEDGEEIDFTFDI